MLCLRRALPLLSALAALALPSALSAQVAVITVAVAPPALPVYDQPPIPGSGYIWTPGFWAYGAAGYYWVPGTWIEAPAVGLLWTPGYWGWGDGVYVWHGGYWGPHIGFYGGINYGFGYVGTGYAGGYWRGGVFSYNTTVNNFGNTHITNVYNKTVINNTTVTNVSFNGSSGGIAAQPTPQEQAAAHEQHTSPTTMQTQHIQSASTNRSLLASVNHGTPAIAATTKPGEFSGEGIVRAKDAKTLTNTPTNGVPGGGTHPLNASREPETTGSNPPNQNTTVTQPHPLNAATTSGPAGQKPLQNAMTARIPPSPAPHQVVRKEGPKKPNHP